MNKQQSPITKWHEIIFKEWDRIGQLTIQSLEKKIPTFLVKEEATYWRNEKKVWLFWRKKIDRRFGWKNWLFSKNTDFLAKKQSDHGTNIIGYGTNIIGYLSATMKFLDSSKFHDDLLLFRVNGKRLKNREKKEERITSKIESRTTPKWNGEHKFSWNCFFMNLNEKSAFHLEKV